MSQIFEKLQEANVQTTEELRTFGGRFFKEVLSDNEDFFKNRKPEFKVAFLNNVYLDSIIFRHNEESPVDTDENFMKEILRLARIIFASEELVVDGLTFCIGDTYDMFGSEWANECLDADTYVASAFSASLETDEFSIGLDDDTKVAIASYFETLAKVGCDMTLVEKETGYLSRYDDEVERYMESLLAA